MRIVFGAPELDFAAQLVLHATLMRTGIFSGGSFRGFWGYFCMPELDIAAQVAVHNHLDELPDCDDHVASNQPLWN